MNNINTVISGEYQGTNVSLVWGSLSIGKKSIDKKEVENIEIIDVLVNKKIDGEHEIHYSIDINFKTGEISRILVDKERHDKIVELFPDNEENYLNMLLKKGYKIIGYSSDVIANSGLAAGSLVHTILLQKGLDIKQIVFNTWKQKQIGCFIHSLSEEK